MKNYIVESADWKRCIAANSPMEAATKAVEQLLDEEKDCSFGAIIGVQEETMTKKDQVYVYAPTVLANAGQYRIAKQLEKKIDLLKKFL